jgi:hypothetical protein
MPQAKDGGAKGTKKDETVDWTELHSKVRRHALPWLFALFCQMKNL